MIYGVNWDNGNGGCGTFPDRFDTEAEAETYAETWARERNLEDLGFNDAEVEAVGGEGCYTAEAILIAGNCLTCNTQCDEEGICPKCAAAEAREED